MNDEFGSLASFFARRKRTMKHWEGAVELRRGRAFDVQINYQGYFSALPY